VVRTDLVEVIDVLQGFGRPVGKDFNNMTFRLFIGKEFFMGMRMPYLEDPVRLPSANIAQDPKPKRPLN